MHRLKKYLTSRLLIIAVLIVLQIWLLFMVLYQVALYYQIYQYLYILAVILVIRIINRNEDPSYKIAWCILILLLPLFGSTLYLLCVGRKMPKKLSKGTTEASQRMKHLLKEDPAVLQDLEAQGHAAVGKMFRYGIHGSNFPVYLNTEATYFSSGEAWFPVFLDELKKAKHFIFIEMFIIDEGKAWDAVLAILKEKAAQGVEVKLIYDDFGCALTLPDHYDRKLNQMGIETYRFNHMRPALIIQMNNRDHRKICVIDNQVGFTGGVNIADEYMNYISRFGYWKDSSIMIRGEAVWSMSVMFLGMYSYLKNDDPSIDYEKYHLPASAENPQGLFQPFSDTPTDSEEVGLAMHLNMINHARKYVYIDTPYLVLNNALQEALILAAKNGVDVRICVPHIPDKILVFGMTRSNYEVLLEAGVRIYEFTPGFNHCKNVVSDDRLAIVGTVNTDYRSYYLHFEDGILMYDTPAVLEIRKDFEQTLQKSQEVTLADCRKTNALIRLARAILNLFAPLF